MTPYYEREGICVYHGDASGVMEALPTGEFYLTLTDPPYNWINRASGGLRALDKGAADSAPVDVPTTAAHLARLTVGSLYVFTAAERLSEWLRAFVDGGLSVRGCVWQKSNPSPMNGQRLWLSGAEFCAYARKPKAYFSERCQPNVWRAPVARGIDHPTPKPVALMRRLIEASCPPGGRVFDPFLGSGSTLVAAAECGRRGVGVELDERYADLAARRIDRALDVGVAA